MGQGLIAMRDLEIKGSGNILGPQQHGHMTAVGYELYCKLLDEEIRPQGRDGTKAHGDNHRYKEKCLYRRWVHSPGRAKDRDLQEDCRHRRHLQDKYDIEEELEDRWDIPEPVSNLIDIAYIKALAGGLGISGSIHRDREVILRLTGSKLRFQIPDSLE